jgi:hypothetical protein
MTTARTSGDIYDSLSGILCKHSLRKYGFSDFSKSMEMAASWDVALCGVVDVE